MHFTLFLFVTLFSDVAWSIEESSEQDRQLKQNEDLKTIKSQIDQIEDSLDNLASNLNTTNEQILNIRKALKNAQLSKPLPRNCREIQQAGFTTGIYTIQPQFSLEPFLVSCNMESEGGGWTYFLNRFNGKEDFYRNWNEYKNGFGNLAEEFWLGLENLHQLTGYEVNELLVELEDWDGQQVYAHYDLFAVGSEGEGYRMKLLGGYNGTAGNSLEDHAGMQFSTNDRDQDKYKGNCAKARGGGWWYKICVECHLTGKYRKGKTTDEYNVMFWEKFRGSGYSLKEARMMVRPRDWN